MKTFRCLLMAAAVIFAGACPMSISAKIDKKYHEKIAKKVWGENDTLFAPDMVIPDSILQNNSAVIICNLDDIETVNERNASIYKASGMTNRICRRHLNRIMVKIIDRSAFDDFSEFEFDEKSSVKSGMLLYDYKAAFGARIHYPDGTIRVVDINEAIEIADGKKEKDNIRYKIAIPGLTENCVLDVFKYEDETIEELDLDYIDMKLCGTYPIMHRVIRGKFDPALTIEYKTYNGAPALTSEKISDNCTKGLLHVEMVPGVPYKRFVNSKRQLPFIRMNFLNNSSKLVYHPATARRGGLRGNIAAGTIYRDIFSYLKDGVYDSPLPGRAAKLVKDYYLKNNPGASPRQLADAAALALRYANATADEEDSSNRNVYLNLLYIDALNKLKVYSPDSIGFAFFNPVDAVPTTGIATWDEPRFVTIVGDSCYDMSAAYHYPPGCMEALFYGQEGGAFIGDRKTLPRNTLPTVVKAPMPRQGNTRMSMSATATITPDNKVILERTMRHTGLYKDVVEGITDKYEWIDSVEKFFCIPENKRFKAKDRDNVGRAKELRDFFKDECETFVGVKADTILSYSVTSRGILPGRNHVSYNVTAQLPDLVEELNPETLSCSVGKLFGDNTRLPEMERNRIFDGMVNAPYHEGRSLIFKIPEGYTFDPASLEALTINKRNPVGLFSSSPTINDDGDIAFTVQLRIGTPIIPLDHWNELLELLDAAADFSETRLILTRK